MPRPRHPRYGRFLFTGAVLGFVISFVLLQVFEGRRGGADRTELTILLTAMLMGLGALLAGLLAVLSERRNPSARPADDDAGKTAPSP